MVDEADSGPIDVNRAIRLENVVLGGEFNFTVPEKSRKNPSAEAQIPHPIAELLLDRRKLAKLKSSSRSEALELQHQKMWLRQWYRLQKQEFELMAETYIMPIAIYQDLMIGISPGESEERGDESSRNATPVPKLENGREEEADLMRGLEEAILANEEMRWKQEDFKEAMPQMWATLGHEGLSQNLQEGLIKLSSASDDLEIVTQIEISRRSSFADSGFHSQGSRKSSAQERSAGSHSKMHTASLEGHKVLSSEEKEGESDDEDMGVQKACETRLTDAKMAEKKIRAVNYENESAIVKEEAGDSGAEEDLKEEKKKELLRLEKFCPKCNLKMAVKFNLDCVDSPDSSKWVQFRCIECDTWKVDELSELEKTFQSVLTDIADCYAKKLAVIATKREQMRTQKPDDRSIQLVKYFLEVYAGHPNVEELWKDMFCRMVSGGTVKRARFVKEWMEEDVLLRNSERACAMDLQREKDKVGAEWNKMKCEKMERRREMKSFGELVKRQEELCENLHHVLEVLRNERRKEDEIEAEKRRRRKEAERLKQEKRRKSENERQKNLKKRLSDYHAHQERYRLERQFELERELFIAERKKRERALQDFIRVNLRRVILEKKQEEAKVKEENAKIDELAREARLETLRRVARQRMGLDMKADAETAMQNTEAFDARVKALAEEKEMKVMAGRKFKLDGYKDEEILADQRVMVEMQLREAGLLGSEKRPSSAYMTKALLKDVNPPSKPRPDMNSQILLQETK